jgi:antitoxin (DNA-binding transcriptional repressor) of toxin-antitoxin stability system
LLLLKCDAKMHHMKRASVRDLRYHFAQVEKMLRRGEKIEITKRRRVIARLMPVESSEEPPRPDFAALLKKIYGDKKLKVSGAQLIARERDRY